MDKNRKTSAGLADNLFVIVVFARPPLHDQRKMVFQFCLAESLRLNGQCKRKCQGKQLRIDAWR